MVACKPGWPVAVRSKAAQRAMPSLEQDIAAGNLLGLRGYLRKNIHAPGYRLPAEERVRAVTGEGLECTLPPQSSIIVRR